MDLFPPVNALFLFYFAPEHIRLKVTNDHRHSVLASRPPVCRLAPHSDDHFPKPEEHLADVNDKIWTATVAFIIMR
jgi:hypothetical protein